MMFTVNYNNAKNIPVKQNTTMILSVNQNTEIIIVLQLTHSYDVYRQL